MRIAVVLADAPPRSDRAGARRLDRFAGLLADRGHDVTVYCTAWWTDATVATTRDGVRYYAVTIAPAVTSYVARLPALLARDRPDVVVAAPSPPAVIPAARLGAVLVRAPLICDWFGDEPATAESRLTGPAARLPGRVVVPSELQRTRVRERGAGTDATVVIPESVDFTRIEATAPGDPVDVVYARRLDADANLESLLLALAELRRAREWTATVIGDGPERTAYTAQAAELGIDDRVRFVGELARDERIAVYRAGHAFVQTARREVFAHELLWALAAGCVGIVEYQGESSAHELIERRDRGIRVTESEALDDAIERAWGYEHRDIDDSFREFDHAAVVGDYLELFRECGVDAR